MIRFILNFFLFGILFYLIYLFFPDAFHKLVSWAQVVFDFFKDLFGQLSGRFHKVGGDHPTQALALMLPLWFDFIRIRPSGP